MTMQLGMRPMNMNAQLMGTANLQQATMMNQPIMQSSMNQTIMQSSMNQPIMQPSMNQPIMQPSIGVYNQPIGMQQQGIMNPVMMQSQGMNMGQRPIMQQGHVQQSGLQQPTRNSGYPQQSNMYQGMYGNQM
jgi:hypothetical protein